MRCPSCGNVISDGLKICPQCGYLLPDDSGIKKPGSISKYVGAIVLIAIIAIGVGLYITEESGKPAKDFVPENVNFYIVLSKGGIMEVDTGELPIDLPLEDIPSDIMDKALIKHVEKICIFGWDAEADEMVVSMAVTDKDSFQLELDKELKSISQETYKDVMIHLTDETVDYFWIKNDIVIGQKEKLKRCIDVVKGDELSLNSSSDFKTMFEKIPDGTVMLYANEKFLEKVGDISDIGGEISEFQHMRDFGASITIKGKDSFDATFVFELKSAEDAASAAQKLNSVLEMLSALGGEVQLEFSVENEDRYVIFVLGVRGMA
ncbi:MAG: zinc ribbon domain-containing protein [Candidatus Methanofastidiosia archaeon]